MITKQKKDNKKDDDLIVDKDPLWKPTFKQAALFSAGAALIIDLGYVSPNPAFSTMLTTFCLSGVIGLRIPYFILYSGANIQKQYYLLINHLS